MPRNSFEKLQQDQPYDLYIINQILMAQQLNDCTICKPEDQEVKNILYSLLTSIARIRDTTTDSEPKQSLDFSSFMKIVFSHNFKTSKDSKNCSHEIIKKQFMRKLGIDASALGQYCKIKGLQIAKYNYHTDVLGLQIKTFPRHFPTKSKSTLESRSSIDFQLSGMSDEQPIKKQEEDPYKNVPLFNHNGSIPFPHAYNNYMNQICMSFGNMSMGYCPYENPQNRESRINQQRMNMISHTPKKEQEEF